MSRWFDKLRGKKRETAAEPTVLVFVPALVDLLRVYERDKGEPLTEAEVLEIRDGAACIALPSTQARKFEEGRGGDIDADAVWQQWQAFREQRDADADG